MNWSLGIEYVQDLKWEMGYQELRIPESISGTNVL